MKNYLLLFLVILSYNLKSQIILLQTYDSASSSQGNANPQVSQLMLVKFEVSGERYVKVNSLSKKISVYSIGHALLKTIDCSSFPIYPPFPTKMGDILYLSEQLFDTDSGLEFMYVTKTEPSSGWPSWYTGIYNDDGSLIFSDTGAAIIKSNIPLQQYPIYNTSQGTIMILSYTTGEAKIFSLPGTLSTAIQQGNEQLMHAQGSLSNLYPNPTSGKVTLQYELPKGEREGEIILFNQQGAEVKRYKVDDTFNDLLLDNTMMPAGVYYWQLTTAKGAAGSKKMVVVK